MFAASLPLSLPLPINLSYSISFILLLRYLGSVIGIDPLLHGARAVKLLEDKLSPKSINIKLIDENPIDKIWTENRSPVPNGMLRIHPKEFAGKSIQDKLADIREALIENQVKFLFYISTSILF